MPCGHFEKSLRSSSANSDSLILVVSAIAFRSIPRRSRSSLRRGPNVSRSACMLLRKDSWNNDSVQAKNRGLAARQCGGMLSDDPCGPSDNFVLVAMRSAEHAVVVVIHQAVKRLADLPGKAR